ncbi:class I SAM-dependent methyltransferase [candidate division FCPU426 bacterium]|nr:class I SAM-dependent methyltransferase [candidate division FCPU426 bacterium]
MIRFERAARTWDQESRRVELARTIAVAMQRELAFAGQEVVLDFGAGTGLVTLHIAAQVKRMYAVDTSRGMLAQLRKKYRREKAGNIRILPIDIFTDSPPEPVDVIISAMTLHHVPDIEALARRFYSLLRSGGRCALADLEEEQGDFHAHTEGVYHFGFAPETLRAWFGNAGFQNLAVRNIHATSRRTATGEEKSFPVFLLTGEKK